MPLTPGSRLGVYEVVAPLGAGAMGEVWRARDTRLSREVALKVLPESLSQDRERLQRFEREAQVLASLNHPSIAAIYGVEEAGGATALVLELVEGQTLDQKIAQGRLPADEAVAIARQIAEGLEYAHDRGVVHRDLKPANVKLAPDGRVKVLDFGLAKAIAADMTGRSDSAISPTITSLGTIAGVVLGTAAYMSPEQARGTGVDRRADIWSFGAVLWEMLTGRRAFEGDTVSDTLASVLRAPIEWNELPPATPPGVVRLLKRCLERDPKKRLRDIGEARIALENLGVEPEPAATEAAVPAPRPRRLAGLSWALIAFAIAITAIAIVGLTREPLPDERVVRFQIGPDEAIATMTWPQIAPDGSMLAFVATDRAGKNAIWVRPLDAFKAFPLAGTEGATRPWWSPDSRFLAFFIGGQLKKIPATGGPTQPVCEVDGGADGSWGSTGTILFDGRAIDPIRRVEAAGGVAAQATQPDPSSQEIGQSWPYFLPDGKHFLYLGMSKSPNEKATIRVGTLGETSSKALVKTDSRAAYANGYLLYVLQGTLVAQRFDTSTLDVSGEPRPLVENLGVDANATAPFSASKEGTLVFLQGGVAADSELVWVDRSGRELAKLGQPGPYRDLALSADGTRLAYAMEDRRSSTEDIWVYDLKRDVASRLTFDAGVDTFPVWSPDGSRIAFTSNRDGHFSLMIKDAGGTGSDQPLHADPDGELGPTDWSRDGRLIAFNSLPPSRRWQVKLLAVQGGTKPEDYLVQNVNQLNAAFSPDGRFIAYQSNESGVVEVYVQTYPPSGGKWQISSGGGTEPKWRGDGKELFYRKPGDEIYAVPVSTGARFEPGIPKPLFKRELERNGLLRSRWLVTADGERFLLNATRETKGVPPFSVVLNWPATLEKD